MPPDAPAPTAGTPEAADAPATDGRPFWRTQLPGMPCAPLRDASWRMATGRWIGRALAAAAFGLRVFHPHRIPRAGPVLVAANHPTWLDPGLLWLALPRRIHFMAWAPLFQVPVVGMLTAAGGAFPVKAEGGREALARAKRLLHAGRCVGIFPEGGRSAPDGTLLPFLPGMAMLAIWTGATVVPITLDGARPCWPRGQRFPRPGQIRVHVHAPIPPEATGRAAARGEAPFRLTVRVRAAIASAYRDGKVAPQD